MLPDDGKIDNASGTFVELQSSQVRLKPSGVLVFASLTSKNVSHKQMQVQQELIANGLIECNAGIEFDTGTGITFADGTFQSTAPTGSAGGPDVTVVGSTGGPTAGWISSAATGDFYIEVVN